MPKSKAKTNEVASEEEVKTSEATAKEECVLMRRGDRDAEVHPNEVDNYFKGGWAKV